MTDMSITARALALPGARRRVRLVFRRSFPQRAALEALAALTRERLPDTVAPTADARPGADGRPNRQPIREVVDWER